MTKTRTALYLAVIAGLFVLAITWYYLAFRGASSLSTQKFDGSRALRDVETQVSFGPRIPQSEAHARALEWMKAELITAGWHIREQDLTVMGHPIRNLIAFRAEGAPQFILGAHYDSRIHADRDPDPELRTQPVPGADDGASGVAVLIELARTLPPETAPVWLVFFDAEDNGDIPGWDWILGSRAFVANMAVKPRGMILLDMVGDSDLTIPMEANSDVALRTSIWNTAGALGLGGFFPPRVKYSIEDDHLPFIRAGIPAVDIIDIDYAYWHTTHDTPDHVSARSLQIVGDVLRSWLMAQPTLAPPATAGAASPTAAP